MYSLGVGGSWLTRMGEGVQLERKQICTHKIAGAPPPPASPHRTPTPTSAGATVNPEPWLDLAYKRPLSFSRLLHLSPIPPVIFLSLLHSELFSKSQAALRGKHRDRSVEGRNKCYCICCGGNNLKMNNAFWVPWGTYVFLTFPLFPCLSLFVREVWGETELA